eukprot:1151695-Pelagomonas_calceolata.AAC.3
MPAHLNHSGMNMSEGATYLQALLHAISWLVTCYNREALLTVNAGQSFPIGYRWVIEVLSDRKLKGSFCHLCPDLACLLSRW